MASNIFTDEKATTHSFCDDFNLDSFRYTTPERIAQLKQILDLSDSPVITTAAVLYDPKVNQYTNHALPVIPKTIHKAQFMITGEWADRQDLLESVERFRFQSGIVFTKQCANIPELLACSDLLVIPTLIDPRLIVSIEVFTVEKSIITSKVERVKEIVEDGLAGLVISAAEPA